MGLDTNHGCFNGPYSQFMRWREWVAEQVGINLRMMQGFFLRGIDMKPFTITRDQAFEHMNEMFRIGPEYYDIVANVARFPYGVPWSECDPLTKLLHHSDCEGRLKWFDAKPLAYRLLNILRAAEDDTKWPTNSTTGELLWTDWRVGRGTYDGMVPATKRFIAGLVKSHKSRVDVKFR